MLNNLITVVLEMGLKDHDCHRELPRDDKFNGLGLGGGALSFQEVMFMAGVIHVERPDVVLELGTSNGGSTVALGAVLKDIGHGKLVTVDYAPNKPEKASELVLKYQLPVEFVNGSSSLDVLPRYPVNQHLRYLVFSDTDIKVRPEEVNLVFDRFPKGTTVIVHDTSDLHPLGPMKLKEKMRHQIEAVEMSSPRGITILKVK